MSFRSACGACFFSMGLFMLVVGVWKRHTLWDGIREVKVVRAVQTAPVKPTNSEVTVGPLKVEYRWYNRDKSAGCDKQPMNCNTTGTYQLRDNENKIWVVQFCEPIPEIRADSTIILTYLKNDEECTRFVNAQVVSEPALTPEDDKPKPKPKGAK